MNKNKFNVLVIFLALVILPSILALNKNESESFKYLEALKKIKNDKDLTKKEKDLLIIVATKMFYIQFLTDYRLMKEKEKYLELQLKQEKDNFIYQKHLINKAKGSKSIFNDFLTMRY